MTLSEERITASRSSLRAVGDDRRQPARSARPQSPCGGAGSINPLRARIQHVNIQVAAFDDMVAAYQRMAQTGFGVALSIGRRTNNKELSFYAIAPSGFEWEAGLNPGLNPIVIDNQDAWEPTTHQGISMWGTSPGLKDHRQVRAVQDRCAVARTTRRLCPGPVQGNP